MDLPAETINQFVNVVKNMTSNDSTEKAKTDETKPPNGGTNCDIKNNRKRRRTRVSSFGAKASRESGTRWSWDFFSMIVLGLLFVTSMGMLEKEVDYHLQRRKDLDAIRDKVVTENTAGYTPGSVIQTFLTTSTNPKLFSVSSIDVLNPNDFNTRTSSLLTNADFELSELRIDPYIRMYGQFHIRNVRTLRDALMTRMHPGHPALVPDGAVVANTVDMDTLITYAAEMDFINTQADGLVDFINALVN